jgi:hypothetical protein
MMMQSCQHGLVIELCSKVRQRLSLSLSFSHVITDLEGSPILIAIKKD